MARKHFATIRVMKYGRLTIPSDIRELEGIGEGNYVQISIEKIGESTDGNRQKLIPKKKRYVNGSRVKHD
jgi:bifunctional DNA-binding transcriptional regulator/antitoxin component of YhaV-PrlF toxin-antitoxin module